MKGVIFTEFAEMAETRFGFDAVDRMFEVAKPAASGVYAATGTYPASELFALVGALSHVVSVPVPKLVHAFGSHLFGALVRMHPEYILRARDCFEFLESIDSHIHVEVRKLYPDAELPRFSSRTDADRMVMELEYRSPRRLDDLAQGLIEASLVHFREVATVTRSALANDESGCLFTIRKSAAGTRT